MQKLLYGIKLGIVLFLISGCFTSKKTTNDDAYSLEPVDTTVIELPEDAVAVTPSIYRPSFSIVNDLVHTKLDVKFDWQKQYLYGRAWITLKPHFYPTDSLVLDAKIFDLHKVELVKTGGNIALDYTYDSAQIHIALDKKHSSEDSYTVYIEYTAKPGEIRAIGSDAINERRGLYFINPDGKEPDKPRQLWTQGETESSSCWFPTIDKPNVKMTTELCMTVENGFVTLSNGLMVSTKDNGDGTHTDCWKMDLPYSPYLVMMAAGPFAVVKDKYKNMEVNYYVDKKYEPYARKIFGNTPEMIDFFSNAIGVPYPWPKYSQVVVHDFVTGAMENVTATVHYDALHQTAREMIDGNHEDIISHELFHQWFGDLVTCESWANVSLNEGFATYGEYLWNEHKYGQDEADYQLYNDLQMYLNQAQASLDPLIRFYYNDNEEMFDATVYQKGSRVLHMLRKYVGDEAFFRSLKLYLEENRFSNVEAHQLRLAFEKVTGQDLNWFFNQWYFHKGHPMLSISYYYDADSGEQYININQLQDSAEDIPIYRLPLKVDIYENGSVEHHNIIVEDQYQSFTFPCKTKPQLVNVDAEKMLLCEKNDYKSDTAFNFQLQHAPLFLDRLEAIQYFANDPASPFYQPSVLKGMNDVHWAIRAASVECAYLNTTEDSAGLIRNKISSLAKSDPSSKVRAKAIADMDAWNDKSVIPLLENALKDSSYMVISSALVALSKLDTIKAYKAAQILEDDNSEEIVDALSAIYAKWGGSEKNAYFVRRLKDPEVSYNTVALYGQFVSRFVDQPPITDSAIAILTEIGKKDSKWYVRFAAVLSLENIRIAMYTLQETWNNEYLQASDNETKHKVQSNLEWLTNKIAVLEEELNRIKSAETNETLKSMYGIH